MYSYFHFKQAERRGIFLFLLLISAVFIWPSVYGHYLQKEQSFEIDLLILDTLEVKRNTKFKRSEKYVTSSLIPFDTLFFFNPNQVSMEQLILLGLSGKVAHTFVNFRAKGGRFYQKTDLLKIYGLEESWYLKVENYIQLPPKTSSAKNAKYAPAIKSPRPPKAVMSIKVNQATAEEWTRLKGIGPVLSNRIVKFREKLGGFYTIDQVGQTYGLADSVFQKIKTQMVLETAPRPLHINKWSKEELASHPYISWKAAQIITSYRAMHGPFKNRAAIDQVQVLNQEKIDLLMPYIDFCFPCEPK